MELQVKKFVTGPIETNTYVVSHENNGCLLIDPSSGCKEVISYIKDKGFSLEAICLTHGHFDHFLGLEEILRSFPGTDVWIHPAEKYYLLDADYNGSFMMGMKLTYTGPVKEYNDGFMQIGNFDVTVFHVPGHSSGGAALLIGNYCFCGDSLFAGSIGRSDFPGCDGAALIKNIKEKLMSLPDDTVVCSGHGGRSTIGRERRTNPFL